MRIMCPMCPKTNQKVLEKPRLKCQELKSGFYKVAFGSSKHIFFDVCESVSLIEREVKHPA